jgi:hypothetical protein
MGKTTNSPSEDFVPREDDDSNLYEVKELIGKRRWKGKTQFLVVWDGLDKSGKPWPDSWQYKEDCTPDLVRAWEERKAQKKKTGSRRKNSKGAFFA